MTLSNYTYLLLNVLTLAVPLLRSFEPRVQFWKRWFALFPAIAVAGALFIVWDIVFTRAGIWGFNEQFVTGVDLLWLPIEEWLFFLTVPYACVFIYDCVNYFWPETRLDAVATKLAAGGFGLMLMLALAFWDRTYTVVTSVAGCACMGVAVLKRPSYLGRFFRSYFIALVPFFLVNGALTGGLSAEPVVWYDDRENLGVRLGTIPLDDVAYLMVLLWLVIAGYETRLARRNRWARSRVKQPHR